MPNPYVRIHRWGFSGTTDVLAWSNGTDEWCKNLAEFTSYISVMKTPEEAIKFKQSFCERISEDTGKVFTIEDLDRIVTKSDYACGAWALAEFTHIVETNFKCVKEGKEPFYLAPSIAGDRLIKSLIKKKPEDADR